jgi:hypothetical protein
MRLRSLFLRNRAGAAALKSHDAATLGETRGIAMDQRFKEQYAEQGRHLQFMGFAVEDMEPEELYAVIGFLLEKVGEDPKAQLKQEAPLGAPHSDPPKNDGLVEG